MNSETPVNCIFGEGAPVGNAANGAEWIDTLTDSFYKFYGGAWHQIASGGGGGGLPYYNGPYGYYVTPAFTVPYSGNLFFYGASSLNYGGGISLTAGYGAMYNGTININAGNSISLTSAYKVELSEIGGNQIQLKGGNTYLNGLPTAPGVSGSLWVDTTGANNYVKVAP
jgi:hypothetical protein